MTFTKEQLIAQAQKNIEVLRGAVEKIPGGSDAAVIHLRLAEITLASLEAEPVAWTTGRYSQNIGYKFGEKEPDEAPCIMSIYWDFDTFRTHTDCDATALRWLEEAIKNTGAKPLYTTPPAPTVPNECPAEIRELMASYSDALFDDEDAQEIWNACRAAMLQGAAVNSPAIPDGWVVCSERMPEGMQTVITSNGFDIGQAWWDGEGWNSFDCHDVVPGAVTQWMPLPAAPQQEAL